MGGSSLYQEGHRQAQGVAAGTLAMHVQPVVHGWCAAAVLAE